MDPGLVSSEERGPPLKEIVPSLRAPPSPGDHLLRDRFIVWWHGQSPPPPQYCPRQNNRSPGPNIVAMPGPPLLWLVPPCSLIRRNRSERPAGWDMDKVAQLCQVKMKLSNSLEAGVIRIYTPLTNSTPGSLYSCEYGDPLSGMV